MLLGAVNQRPSGQGGHPAGAVLPMGCQLLCRSLIKIGCKVLPAQVPVFPIPTRTAGAHVSLTLSPLLSASEPGSTPVM